MRAGCSARFRCRIYDMSDVPGSAPDGRSLVLRLSVPAQGGLRTLATEVATRIATFLGSNPPDAESAGATLEGLANRVAPHGGEDDIHFEFCEVDGELLIRARCRDRVSEVRYPLPA
jgi:hypothetical protein